jgi:hypothetical protein
MGEEIVMSVVLGIDNCLFDVGDLGLARRHYGELLGLTETFAFESAGIVGYALGPERPGLMIRETSGKTRSGPSGPHLWLEVPDARALADQLADLVEFSAPVQSIFTGIYFEVADIWGNVVGFTDYSAQPDKAR